MQTATKLQIEFISKWAIAGTILTLSLTWWLLKTYVFTPTISIETLNFPTETSQSSYKKTPHTPNKTLKYLELVKTTTHMNSPYLSTMMMIYDGIRWRIFSKT